MQTDRILRQWDKGSKSQRVAILVELIQRHQRSTGAEIEKDLGPSAMLLFTRITAWLRLTYQLHNELSVQLSALSLFLQGQRFLANFMEVGGIQTLTDILVTAKDHATQQLDKSNALLLLIHVANAGRVYREMVCDGQGVDNIVKATLEECSEKTLDLTSSLFIALGQGNPRKASLVHSGLIYLMLHGGEPAQLCAATTLRSLQLAKQYYSDKLQVGGSIAVGSSTITMVGAESGAAEAYDTLLDAFFHLISRESVKLRFEGLELLNIASQNAFLASAIVSRCLDAMDTITERANIPTSSGDAASDTSRQALLRLQSTCGKLLADIVSKVSPVNEGAYERIILLCDRRSAHVSLVMFLLQDNAAHDIATQRDTCAALRVLCLAQQRIKRNVGTLADVSSWLSESIGQPLVDALLLSDVPSDALVQSIEQALRAHRQRTDDANSMARKNDEATALERTDSNAAMEKSLFAAVPPQLRGKAAASVERLTM